MAQDWFVVHNGKENGPLTAQQLKQMAATGKLAPDDLVRRADMQAASKASKIKGLFNGPVAPSAPTSEQAAPPAPSDTPSSEPIWEKVAIIAASVVFCFPVGLILVWRHSTWSQARKWKWTGATLGVFLCLAVLSKLNPPKDRPEQVAAKQTVTKGSEANKRIEAKSGGVTIKHDRYTQIIMPKIPPDRVIDSSKAGPHQKVSTPAVVPDISKVDFMNGPNGEPIQIVKYGEDYGHFYLNKEGKSVYHGPWYTLFKNGKTKEETVYIHGAVTFSQEWDEQGRALRMEIFRSDTEHTQSIFAYYKNGYPEFNGQFVKVRYLPNEYGHKVQRVPDGLHFYYWEQNGRVRQEEMYENGRQVGIAIYDLGGNKTLGRGKLGSEVSNGNAQPAKDAEGGKGGTIADFIARMRGYARQDWPTTESSVANETWLQL